MNSVDPVNCSNVVDNVSFLSLFLREELVANLASLGYEQMTPVQAQSLPLMLMGKDIIAQAKTGSGKTAAFGLSLLHHLKPEYLKVQALVLCPTRELAEQVSQALRRLARLLPNVKILNVSGGMPFRPQQESLKHGAHIIVGTPGRVQKHLDKETLSLASLQTLVLDEADRMLDMGFFDAIKNILKICPKKRQSLLFSATFPADIKKLSAEFMQDPIRVIVEETYNHLDIEQHFYETSHPDDKYSLLKAILLHHKPLSTLIFCNTKEQTLKISGRLTKEGFSAIALNGDMEQIDRDMAMIRFANQSCSILVATDVAARGLDIKELPCVINVDMAFDHDVHIHRIGRTGRAGSQGLAISLTTPNDAARVLAVEAHLGRAVVWKNAHALNKTDSRINVPEMVTICLSAGRKDKIRAGDILGALTKDAGLLANVIGKIDISTLYSYVAIHKNDVNKALQYFQEGKLKGRKVRVRKLT